MHVTSSLLRTVLRRFRRTVECPNCRTWTSRLVYDTPEELHYHCDTCGLTCELPLR